MKKLKWTPYDGADDSRCGVSGARAYSARVRADPSARANGATRPPKHSCDDPKNLSRIFGAHTLLTRY